MALAPHVGTNSSPSLVLHQIRMGILGPGPDHRPVSLASLNPLHPRTPSPNQGLTLPAGLRRLAIAIVILGGPQRGTTVAGAVSSVWLEISCIPWLVGTRTLARCLPALAQVPTPYLEAGSPAPALVQNLELGRSIRGTKPLSQIVGRIQTPDRRRASNRRHTIGQVLYLVQATQARAIEIVTEIRPPSGPRVASGATDEVAMIARGKETGIDTVREGTPILGVIQTSINHSRADLTLPRLGLVWT